MEKGFNLSIRIKRVKITEKKINIFDLDERYYLVHCISADFKMGSGFATGFVRNFDMRRKLFNKYGKNINHPCALLVDNVFNLVTKNLYYQKPSYITLRNSLFNMYNICKEKNIKHIAIPYKMACNRDKLNWDKVFKMIENIFYDLNIEILICNNEKGVIES